MPQTSRPLVLLPVLAVLIHPASAETRADLLASLDQTMATAEASLREGELQVAESRYRDAMRDGWLILGAIHAAEGRLPDARDAFRHASTSAVDADSALRALALVHLQMREPAEASLLLTRLVGRYPTDVSLRQLLTQALLAGGRPEEAVQELEEAHASAPNDAELTFLLASGYLRLKKAGAAEQLFAALSKAKPLPQTYVLIGRAYRDAGEFGRARAALERALKLDPRTRRAHYYLGTIAVLEEGVVRLEEAIAEFRKELALAPTDPITSLRLGMALVEAQRPADALPHLQRAARSASAPADAFHYLGRCLLSLDRASEAVPALERALALSSGPARDDLRLLGIHYQLALALRAAGRADDAAKQFAAAEALSAKRADASRERLARYMGADAPEPLNVPLPAPPEVAAIQALQPAVRDELQQRARQAIARAALNLGVMHAQAQRFARAAELLETAATADPAFPQVQYSLGIAYFNAQQYTQALAPLERALADTPDRADVRRMLAVAALNAQRFERAAELLADDPGRGDDPSLQYAYGVALVRSNQAELAEAVFARLVAAHAEAPELRVVLGHAHARQGDYDAAVSELQRAIALKSDVAQAHSTLGEIYLKQGKLAEAAAALRTELKYHPEERQAAHALATVLDLDGQQDEALALLRSVLAANPQYGDARYLLGKILLSRGAAREAVGQLESAARFSPEDANVQYQLGQAYEKLGMSAQAEERFELYRQLKDKRRTP